MHTLAALRQSPSPLAPHYSRFRVGERLLLTGHSHQAWPDAGFEGQIEAWRDAAEFVDEKWERAEAKAERVRQGFARLLGAAPGEIALGESTHALLVRFLSALPLAERPRLVTTDGEFHTIRRQLDRLSETSWCEVVKVPAEPVDSLADRLAVKMNRGTAAVLVSSVFFESARIVPGIDRVLLACRQAGAELLVDVYHHLNAVPFSLEADRLADAFVTGGGYKYCQLGEGNAFLRVPPGREAMRPVVTGWYSEFEKLSSRAGGQVPYGDGPALWAGSTYDPTSHYRAARVFDFFAEQKLTPAFLREVSQHQVSFLAERFDALDLDPMVIERDRGIPVAALGGFLALKSPSAGAISKALRARGVWSDYRGETLRLGPAPYLTDRQLEDAMSALGEVARSAAGV